VVDNIGIPVKGLFVLMLCFGIAIGPVNLWLLTRWKRRIWMLWTVPVISATTCAAVFGFMILVEGWSGHLRTEAITVLDQTNHRAATIGWTAFYTPLTPGDGLRFEHDTELSFQHADNLHAYGRGGGRACSLDWTDGQHLARGWVSARVPSHFKLRKNEVRRERVTVRRARDGSLSAVNGLGADVRQLWVADEKGNLYRCGPVEAGKSARLEATGEKLDAGKEQLRPLRDLYTRHWTDAAKELRSTPLGHLPTLGYVADVEGAPFVEDGLRGASDRKTSSLVIGLLKEIENEG
jgi:hypothetical protein